MKETTVKSVLRQGRFASPLSADGAPNQPIGRGLGVAPLNGEHFDEFATTNGKKVGLPGTVPIQTSGKTNGKRSMRFHVKGYGKSGPIQSRTNATSLLLKRWSDSYWLHVYPATVNIFENKEKMEEWKDASDEDKRKKASVKKLVQLSINFDTKGWLKEQISAYKKSHQDEAREEEPSISSETENDLQFIGLPYKLLMEEVRSKYYPRKTKLL